MWLRRAVVLTDLHQFSFKSISKYNSYLNSSKYPFPTSCYSCRLLSSSSLLRNKSKYVYDPKTDSFVPETLVSRIDLNEDKHRYDRNSRYDKNTRYDQNTNDTGKDGGRASFFKKFTRNLFLITGGVVWIGVVLVTLFVDVKETTEFILQLKDGEEEVRLFAFYDIVQSKKDLANVLSKDKENGDEIVDIDTRMKELALHKALTHIKTLGAVKQTVGEPVQFTGYRAAAKVDAMIKNFKYLTEFGLEKLTSDEEEKNMWLAECILEGPNGLLAVNLEFKRVIANDEWVLSKVNVETIRKSGQRLIELSGTLPEGVTFTD